MSVIDEISKLWSDFLGFLSTIIIPDWAGLIALLPVFLWGLGMFGYVLHYILSTDVLSYLRLQLIGKEEGSRTSLREILVPDREDGAIFWRILDAVSKIRYTRS